MIIDEIEVMTMVSAQALANTILKRAFEDKDKSVTPMKLQKLMYFIYRDWYKLKKNQLIYDNFVAWQYGPVLTCIYDEFKSFQNKPIDKFARNAKGEVYVIDESKNIELRNVIDNIWNMYSNCDGICLSHITHQPNGAWYKAIKKGVNASLDLEDVLNDTCK